MRVAVTIATPHPLRKVVELGAGPELDGALAKRIRLTNALSLFGAFVMLASVPFDWKEAPRWMVAEDLLGGLAYFWFPLLNHRGHLVASRLGGLVLSNLIVLGNAALLGPDAHLEMVFFALCAAPFAFFDLGDRAPLAAGVLLPIGCLALAGAGALHGLEHVSDNYSAAAYRVYSTAVTLVVLLFCLYQTSLANARAEEALRADIRARERAERALADSRQTAIYAAKMAALGEMSANIAHEVNNPLAAILLRAQHVLRLVERGEADRDALVKDGQEIAATVHRIRRVVDALRSFAREGEKDPMRPEPLAAIVGDVLAVCAQRFHQHAIALEVAPVPGDLYVECRAVQIAQVLLNLLGNAHDAVEGRTERWVRMAAEAAGDEVRIAVTDSGPRIPPELEARIMEPFFTTKEVGKGTGLGLSMSKGIAEDHGGTLVYDAGAPDTRFVLTLRRAPAPG